MKELKKVLFRRAFFCACLFCLTSPRPQAYPTLAGYALRITAEQTPGGSTLAEELPEFPGYKAVLKGGYDLFYREKSVDSMLTVGRDYSIKGLNGTFVLSAGDGKRGMSAGLNLNELDASIYNRKYLWNGRTVRSLRRIFLELCGRRENIASDWLITVDPWCCQRICGKETSYGNKATLLFKSPAVDLRKTAVFFLSSIKVTASYQNRSLFDATLSVGNRQNTAKRNFPVSINEDGLCCRIDYSGKYADLLYQGAVGFLNSPVDAGDALDLPLSISGNSYSFSASVRAKRLKYRPDIRFSGCYIHSDLNGFDQTGERFLHFDDINSAIAEGWIDLQLGKLCTMGPLASFVSVNGGKGNVALYPFTQWLYILDIPDRIKLYGTKISIIEAGIKGGWLWNPAEKHSVAGGIAVTGCSLYGSSDYAEQVLYFGIWPDYGNRNEHTFFDRRYLIIKASADYFYSFDTYRFFVSVGQILPIEISGRERSTGESETKKYVGRSIWGGLRIEGGIDIKPGPGKRQRKLLTKFQKEEDLLDLEQR